MPIVPLQLESIFVSLIAIVFGLLFFIFGALLAVVGFTFAVYPQKLIGGFSISGLGETRTIEPNPTDTQLIIFRIFGAVGAIFGVIFLSIGIGAIVLTFMPELVGFSHNLV
jgi:hypothetical protein